MKSQMLKRQELFKNLSKPESKDIFQGYDIQCWEGNQGHQYCLSCDNYAVICSEYSCSCRQMHSSCEYFQNINILHQNLNSKLIKNFNVDKILDATHIIADQVLKLQERIEEQLTYFGLNRAEVEISKTIRGGNIKGSDLKKFKKIRQEKKSYEFQDSIINFKQVLQNSKINILKLFHQLEQKLVKQHIEKFQKKLIQEVLKSEIIKSDKQLKTLNDLVNPNLRIQKTKKIFSHYEESETKLIDLFLSCKKRESLLFLIENSNGYKFGAYSECLLERNAITKNDNKSSCLFSINSKFSQASDGSNMLFRQAFTDNLLMGKQLTFEMFDFLENKTSSYVKLNHQYCCCYVKNANFYSVNGISQLTHSKKCEKIKKLQVFQVYFDKQQKPSKVQRKIKENNDKIQKVQIVENTLKNQNKNIVNANKNDSKNQENNEKLKSQQTQQNSKKQEEKNKPVINVQGNNKSGINIFENSVPSLFSSSKKDNLFSHSLEVDKKTLSIFGNKPKPVSEPIVNLFGIKPSANNPKQT